MLERAAGAVEFLDQAVPAAARAASLDDIDRLNAWFGGYALTTAAIRRALADLPRTHPALVVDVGGGRGDFARRLLRWAHRRGRSLRVVVLDRQADQAWRRPGEAAGVLFVRADATALPLREASVDVIATSLTLHHLEPEQAAV